ASSRHCCLVSSSSFFPSIRAALTRRSYWSSAAWRPAASAALLWAAAWSSYSFRIRAALASPSRRMASASALASVSMRDVILSIPFMYGSPPFPCGMGPSQGVHQQQDGGQQRQDGVELHHHAEDDALGPVIGLLGGHVDGGRGHPTLVDGGAVAAHGHGQAGDKDRQALGNSQRHDATGEHADDKQHKEPDNQAVEALGTGDDLQDQALGEVLRRLAEDRKSVV